MIRRDFSPVLPVAPAHWLWAASSGERRNTTLPESTGQTNGTASPFPPGVFITIFKPRVEKDFAPAGNMLALLDFPEMIADRYKVHNLEFCAPHFASTEKTYLLEVKSRLVRAHSQRREHAGRH